MSTTPTLQRDTTVAPNFVPTSGPPLTVVCLPSLSPEAFAAVQANLHEVFPHLPVIIATPDAVPETACPSNIKVSTYTPSAPPRGAWVPTAADYLNAWTVAREHKPSAIILLGPESASVSAETLRLLATGALDHHDLVLPRYTVGPHDALFNSAIIYPLTRSLFSQYVRFPLPIDAALSSRMAERLATAAQRLTANNQGDALVWPVAEAAVAGYAARDIPGEQRILPTPTTDDFNTLLATIAGSVFTDIESKAAFWQRARLNNPPPRVAPYATRPTQHDAAPLDLAPMIESFRNAYTNLRELWSLVLPPNSLLALKKLSIAPAESFRMPDALWARTIYDFLLAYRLRTINRGHLLGALTPLYLAWVASHLQLAGGDSSLVEQHIEATAAAFEADKPYIVARWRWPDRFNP
jgi:glucosylglycerate synthase